MSEKRIEVDFRPDYKGKKFKSEQGLDRKMRIANCEKCKGNPERCEFKLGNISGQRCADDDCMQVINYNIE